jgi:methylated-DNA-[protein]-cysteine S-methyltransferase
MRRARISEPLSLLIEQLDTPIGTMLIVADREGNLCAVDWADHETRMRQQTAGTPFQRDVWTALRHIRCGTTVSYARLAEQIRRPAAFRAVGLANSSNPVGVVGPCHRVIGANGALTGYGGGIERKSWLLQHEANTQR